MLVGLVNAERIQTRVGLEVRGAEEIKTELRSLTKELAGEREECGCRVDRSRRYLRIRES